MKKISLLLAILISMFFISKTNAQGISKLKPTQIIWSADGNKTTLKDATYGIEKPDSLSINILFREDYVRTFEQKDLNFEVRWYYYFSTRRKLIETQFVSFNEKNFKENGSYLISSSKGNISKGWWEVQIIAKKDNGLLQIGKLNKYQILIK